MGSISKPHIWVAGDPITDVFLEGELQPKPTGGAELHVSSRAACSGGAANTYANLVALSRGMPFWAHHTWHMDTTVNRLYYIIPDGLNGQSLIFWDTHHRNKKSLYSCESEYLSGPQLWLPTNTLVISDYDKGSVNVDRSTSSVALRAWDLCVVDSRYRSVHPSLWANALCKIWHCTGDEYDLDFASNFDYVAWTNGPGPIKLGPGGLTPQSPFWLEIPVPCADSIVNEIGAGDTYTAAIAAYLTLLPGAPTLESLEIATLFAIKCCQDVIQQKHTAIIREIPPHPFG